MVMGWQLDSMILMVFYNLNNSRIPWFSNGFPWELDTDVVQNLHSICLSLCYLCEKTHGVPKAWIHRKALHSLRHQKMSRSLGHAHIADEETPAWASVGWQAGDMCLNRRVLPCAILLPGPVWLICTARSCSMPTVWRGSLLVGHHFCPQC